MPFVPSPWRLPGLIAGTVAWLLVLPGGARAQIPTAPLREVGSAVKVCLESMPGSSGSDAVKAMVFTPDGRHLLWAATPVPWNCVAWRGLLSFRRQPGADFVADVAASRDGELLVAEWYGAQRWDARGNLQGPLRVDGAVEAMQLLPDGTAAILASDDVHDLLEMRDLQGKALLNFEDGSQAIPGGPLAIPPDGRVLVGERWVIPLRRRVDHPTRCARHPDRRGPVGRLAPSD